MKPIRKTNRPPSGPNAKQGRSGSAGGDPDGPPKPRVRPGRRPPLRVMTTTLWEYPSQHYDGEHVGPHGSATMQGDKAYVGATPSWVIWQLLTRYTRVGDVVLDPMCGSGTTLDVCADLKRRAIGLDLAPSRPDITRADSRDLPLDNESVDFVFIDPPYSTHVAYSDDPRCIGKLDAGAMPDRTLGDDEAPPQIGEEYYQAMEEVIAEIARVLKPGRYMGLYVSDSYRKHKGAKGGLFMPIGFELFTILRDYLEPVDIVVVARHNAKLARGHWHKAAEEGNYFLRGHNYLFIARRGAGL